jgi:hypothetical protein
MYKTLHLTMRGNKNCQNQISILPYRLYKTPYFGLLFKLTSMINPMRLQLLGKISEEIEMSNLTVTYYIDMENKIIEYNSNDVFGTLTRLPLSP